MNTGLKSSLVLKENTKKSIGEESKAEGLTKVKLQNGNALLQGEISDQQKEADFNRQHEEYIKMKINRKKQLIRLKRQEFGTSSSDEESSSDEQIEQGKATKKIESKRSREKIQGKNSYSESSFSVVLQLKKLSVQTELIFSSKQFEVNKRSIPFSKVIKISLISNENMIGRPKLKVFMVDEEFTIMCSDRLLPDKNEFTVDIFLTFVKMKLELKEIKYIQLEKKNIAQQFTQEQRASAKVFDKLYKKSQIIGTWEQRFILIKEDGLYSYRSTKAKPTMFISLKEMKELQTQFEFYKDRLVIKLIYNTTKTDFGVPIDSKLEWVSHFAGLITRN